MGDLSQAWYDQMSLYVKGIRYTPPPIPGEVPIVLSNEQVERLGLARYYTRSEEMSLGFGLWSDRPVTTVHHVNIEGVILKVAVWGESPIPYGLGLVLSGEAMQQMTPPSTFHFERCKNLHW